MMSENLNPANRVGRATHDANRGVMVVTVDREIAAEFYIAPGVSLDWTLRAAERHRDELIATLAGQTRTDTAPAGRWVVKPWHPELAYPSEEEAVGWYAQDTLHGYCSAPSRDLSAVETELWHRNRED
jgi:hypothetical protein